MRSLLLAFSLGGLAFFASAQEKPVMTWLIQDLPPVSMPVNGQPTAGTTDVLLKLIAREWPEANHQYVVSNTSRALAMLTEGQEACFSGAVITPERERFAYFAPTHFGIPLQLVTRSDLIAKLPKNEAGEVLPANLFDSASLRGLIVRNRSYSPVLDALLNLRSDKSAIGYAVLADGGANVFKMIALGRADYTLEYDFALAYQQEKNADFFASRKLQAVPIAGTHPFVSGIACPRTEWGRQAILRIDAIVAKLAAMPEYRTAADRWLTPSTIKRYRTARQNFFQQRTLPLPIARFD